MKNFSNIHIKTSVPLELYDYAVEVVSWTITASTTKYLLLWYYCKWIYNIDITGINERANKLILESEVKGMYNHTVQVFRIGLLNRQPPIYYSGINNDISGTINETANPINTGWHLK